MRISLSLPLQLCWRFLLLLAAIVFVSSQTLHHELLQRTEGQLVFLLQGYLHQHQNTLDSVNRFLSDSSVTTSRPAREDPLLSFHLMRRLTIDLTRLRDNLLKQVGLVEEIVSVQSSTSVSESELQHAALSLVRLQDTYELNMTDMASGRIQGLQSTPLDARDCFYLGKHSFNYGLYGRAIQWFEQALKDTDDPDFTKEVSPFLETAIRVHDQVLEDSNADATVDTLGHPVFWRGGDKRRLTPESHRKVKLRQLGSDEDDHYNYRDLCRGRILVAPREQARLRCYLSTRRQPYFVLQPVRVEELKKSPTILQFHDLLTDSECLQIQSLAMPKLSQAMVQSLNGSERELSTQRTSQTAWLQHHLHEKIGKINRRVRAVTGLSTDETNGHCEVMQVANYGAGGFYQPHFDYLFVDRSEEEIFNIDPKELEVGDRTATLMFYFSRNYSNDLDGKFKVTESWLPELSDVARGGATVFPRLGVGLWPKKGSAVFWFNLKRNGNGNPLTLHGACPVLQGQKWVANYWFREKGQTFLRRCSRNSDE